MPRCVVDEQHPTVAPLLSLSNVARDDLPLGDELLVGMVLSLCFVSMRCRVKATIVDACFERGGELREVGECPGVPLGSLVGLRLPIRV